MRKSSKVLLIILVAGGLPVATLIGLYVLATRDDPPPDDSDLCVERLDIPDEENGFVDPCAAGDALWQPGGSQERGDDDVPREELDARQRYWRMTRGNGWDGELAAEVLARNREALGLAETALSKPHFQVPATPSNYAKPHVPQLMNIGELLGLRVRAAARAGNWDEAFKAAQQAVSPGRRVQQRKGDVVDWLVGMTVLGIGLERSRDLLAEAELDPGKLKDYAARLSPNGSAGEGLVDAFRSEYAFVGRVLEALKNRKTSISGLSGNGETGPDTWTLVKEWPAIEFTLKLNRSKRRAADIHRAVAACAIFPYAEMQPPELASLDELRRRDFLNRAGNTVCNMFARAVIEEPLICKCRINTATHAVRVLLAMKAFKMEKRRLPKTLDELVPEYLDAVPTDDFDGGPLRYDPENRIIYGVREDLTDDGGFTEDEGLEWWQENKPLEAEDRPEPKPWDLPDPSWPIEF